MVDNYADSLDRRNITKLKVGQRLIVDALKQNQLFVWMFRRCGSSDDKVDVLWLMWLKERRMRLVISLKLSNVRLTGLLEM